MAPGVGSDRFGNTDLWYTRAARACVTLDPATRDAADHDPDHRPDSDADWGSPDLAAQSKLGGLSGRRARIDPPDRDHPPAHGTPLIVDSRGPLTRHSSEGGLPMEKAVTFRFRCEGATSVAL